METFVKILLVLLYPLLVLARVLNAVLGRDPLRLREPDGDTCWIERAPEAGRTSYFSEASAQEGHAHGGFGKPAKAVLALLARLLAPARKTEGREYRAAAERDKDIPDEVYTLW